jgi:hypothetical protein
VIFGGRRAGSVLIAIDVEPLLSRTTDTEELLWADDLRLLGFAHRDCQERARSRLAAGEVDLPEDLIELRIMEDDSELPALERPPAAGRCPFCGNAAGTDEHVIPEWVSKTLNPHRERGRLIDKASDFPRRLVKVDKTFPVCIECNEGWLSVLENDTRSVLETMIRGVDRRVTPDEQRVLATWAYKSALLLDLSGGAPTVPTLLFHMLRHRREPFEGAIVDIGAYIDSTWAVSARPMPLNVGTPGTEPAEGMVATIVVGRVVFQVIVGRGHLSMTDTRTYKDALARIWPACGRDLDWPPNGFAFGDGLLEVLAENFTVATES